MFDDRLGDITDPGTVRIPLRGTAAIVAQNHAASLQTSAVSDQGRGFVRISGWPPSVTTNFPMSLNMIKLYAKAYFAGSVILIGTMILGMATPSLTRASSGLVGISVEIAPVNNNRISIKIVDAEKKSLLFEVERIDAKTIRVIDPTDGSFHECENFKCVVDKRERRSK